MARQSSTPASAVPSSPSRGLQRVRRVWSSSSPRRVRARASSVIARSAAARIAGRAVAAVFARWAPRSRGVGGPGGFSPPPQPARSTRATSESRGPRRNAARTPAPPLPGSIAASGVSARLTQKRTGGLLEDLAPSPRLLLLGGEVLDDLANARRRDLDAVAVADLAEVLVVLRELERDGLEPVLGDADAFGEVQDRRLEHQLVVGLGLDEHDVDARVALLPLARHLVQALVGEQLEGLVADLREAHVADPARAREERADALGEVVDEGHQRVDDDDELRARLDGDVEVRGRHDPAVDELAVADLDRLVDHRQRRRGAHGGRDGHVVPAGAAEDDTLAGVEVGRGEVELGLEQAEVVSAIRV